MKKKKVFKSLSSAIILGAMALTTSCVQGDFSDFYDDDDLSMEGMISLKKGTKGDAPGDIPTDPFSNFPTKDDIIGSEAFKEKADEAWDLMIENSDWYENNNTCREYGFIIYYNTITGALTFGDMIAGPISTYNDPNSNPSIQFEIRDNPSSIIRPCGKFHTHTSAEGQSSTSWRPVGPSGGDLSGNQYPSIIYDYDVEGNLLGGTPSSWENRFFDAGPDRRAY